MSQLKEIVKNSLSAKNVAPNILSTIDTFIQRSIIRLQKDELLPARVWEFKSLSQKQEYTDDDEVVYNFYYLPKDFRKLDEFRPLETYPYNYTSDEYSLYKPKDYKETKSQQDKLQRQFTVVTNNFDKESPYEKLLIARPFPKDDETVKIKYYVNGNTLDWDWISEDYYEAIIMDVEQMLGLRSIQEVDDQVSRAVATHKEQSGKAMSNGKKTLNGGSYFGKRTNRQTRPRQPFKNIY